MGEHPDARRAGRLQPKQHEQEMDEQTYAERWSIPDEGAKSQKGKGRGWSGDPEGHPGAGQKGGRSVSASRDHMRSAGRQGGKAVAADHEQMAAIGRLGGRSPGNGRGRAQG